MNTKEHTDLSKLCIHSITTKPWKMEEAAKIILLQVLKVLLFGVMHWKEEILNKQVECFGKMINYRVALQGRIFSW